MPNSSRTVIKYDQNDEAATRQALQKAMQDFQPLKQNGDLKRAVFWIDTKRREATGVAFYKDEATLKKHEVRGEAFTGNDPDSGQNTIDDKKKNRIKEAKGKQPQTTWFDFVGEV